MKVFKITQEMIDSVKWRKPSFDLIKELKIGKKDRVIELACGSRRMADEIERKTGCRITGIDILGNPDIKMDMRDLKFPKNSFDKAYCHVSFSCVDEDELVLKQVNKVLKLKGLFYFDIVYKYNYAHLKAHILRRDHPKAHSLRKIKKLLKKTGFKILKTNKIYHKKIPIFLENIDLICQKVKEIE